MPTTLEESDIIRIIAAARDGGLSGFGGACGEAAVALNKALFDGRGKLVGAFNEAFLDHDRLIGHVAVLLDGTYWDMDGRPKPFDEIESWGMLDAEDTDYQEQAAALGIEWDDEAAEGVAQVEFDDEAEVLSHFGETDLASFVDAIERARATILPDHEPEASSPAPGR